MSIQAINPATGEVIATHDEMTPPQVDEIIRKVDAAAADWRRASFSDRAVPMRKAAAILRSDARDFAHLMAREMGKPVRDGVAEAQKCAVACEYFADNAARFLARERDRDRRARRATSRSIRSASYSPSCRGTFRSGRCSASPHRG